MILKLKGVIFYRRSFSRTRGGDPTKRSIIRELWISFSRTRGGDPITCCDVAPLVKVFPALAGVILSETSYFRLKLRFSRTRGGDPTQDISSAAILTFFPHMRG